MSTRSCFQQQGLLQNLFWNDSQRGPLATLCPCSSVLAGDLGFPCGAANTGSTAGSRVIPSSLLAFIRNSFNTWIVVVVFGFGLSLCSCCFLKDGVSLCSPCCPKTHCKDQAGLKLTEVLPPLPPFPSTGTKGVHYHAWLHPVFWDEVFTHYCFGPVKVINRKSRCAQGSQRQQKGGEPVLVSML